MKRILSAVLATAIFLSVFAVIPASAQTAKKTSIVDGYPQKPSNVAVWDGSFSRAWYDDTIANDPSATEFTISTAADLAGLSKITKNATEKFQGKTITLANDIWLNAFTMTGDADIVFDSPKNWNDFIIQNFAGTFDGAGHTIYGLYIKNDDTYGAGLFRSFKNNGVVTTVRNLSLDGVSISTKRCAGAIVGMLATDSQTIPSRIENCHVRGVVQATEGLAGGIAGMREGINTSGTGQTHSVKWTGSIADCSMRGAVRIIGAAPNKAYNYAGGILPQLKKTNGAAATIKNTYSYADVDAPSGVAGGLVGYVWVVNTYTVNILNCGSSGKVNGAVAGGLCGRIENGGTNNSPKVVIGNAYFAGTTTGTTIGGLAGEIERKRGSIDTSGLVHLAEGKAVAGSLIGITEIKTATYTEEQMTDGTLLNALNKAATEKSYTAWQKGHQAFPVHVGLQGYVPSVVTVFPEPEAVETLGVLVGAEARLNDLQTSGLRFTMGIRLSWLDSMIAAHTKNEVAPTIEAGILILPTDYFTTYSLAEAASAVLSVDAVRHLDFRFSESEIRTLAENDVAQVRAAIVNLFPNNYDRAFSALGYLRVTDAEGLVKIVDAPYVKEHNSRCILDVAERAYDDRPNGTSPYTAAQLATLCHYLDGVLHMEIVDGMPTVLPSKSKQYTAPYTVSDVTDNSFVLNAAGLTTGDTLVVYVDGKRLSSLSSDVIVAEGKATVMLPERPTLSQQTTIKVYPTGGVVAPVNFPEDLTLRPVVTADDATQSLRWYSSNDAIVSVNESGTLTLLAEGSAYVWAQATDGTTASSNKITVTVTPAVVRAADQQLTLGATQRSRIDVQNHLADPTGYGTAIVSMWRGGASGAFSITTDDSLTGNFGAWNAFTKESGIPVTFFVPGSYDGSRWKEQVEAGGEIGSHTQNHKSSDTMATWGTAEVWMDFYSSIGSIRAAIGEDPVTLAYSYGKSFPAYAAQLFVAARGVTGTPNKGDTVDYLNVNSISKKFTTDFSAMQSQLRTLWDAETKIYGVSYVGGWTCFHFHSVSVSAYTTSDGRTISSATEWLKEMYEQVIRPEVEAEHVWAASFRRVACYAQERDTATLTVTSATENEIRMTLTDLMDDTLFSERLTIKVAVDETWGGVVATQGGKTLNATVKNGVVMVDAAPDAGEIVLTRMAQQ